MKQYVLFFTVIFSGINLSASVVPSAGPNFLGVAASAAQLVFPFVGVTIVHSLLVPTGENPDILDNSFTLGVQGLTIASSCAALNDKGELALQLHSIALAGMICHRIRTDFKRRNR